MCIRDRDRLLAPNYDALYLSILHGRAPVDDARFLAPELVNFLLAPTQGLNYNQLKADVYGAAMTVLHAATRGDTLAIVDMSRGRFSEIQVKARLDSLRREYSSEFVDTLASMLEMDSFLRPDFVALKPKIAALTRGKFEETSRVSPWSSNAEPPHLAGVYTPATAGSWTMVTPLPTTTPYVVTQTPITSPAPAPAPIYMQYPVAPVQVTYPASPPIYISPTTTNLAVHSPTNPTQATNIKIDLDTSGWRPVMKG
eukprot:TRINITY_DN6575_c0_g1_i1.p1 TRINITY_DN6575_c0_g1~~TRINITY_DN6575_c0_g1_i1.p1  ORF type:complete len:275 (-),score=22.67 TRINITY_DN6575_c0_g1_i1:11-775(-)